MSVRKAHNSGRNHLRNVVEYYQQIGQEKAQSVIDSITSSYAAEGQPLPNPAMVPGAFPPPFGFPGRPGQIPPPPFGIPPPGAPGAPGMLPPPGAHGGLPFPPPFNATGTPPTGGFPHPSPTCPKAQACPLHLQAASPTCLSHLPVQRASRLCPVPRWVLRIRRFLLVRVAQKGILLPLAVDLLLGWILGGDFVY
ncbi:hypothetical protein N7499_010550 [Penicillium canescens]|nr:hypothetical protein N7499_010550 [Penicillium canescens]